MTLPRRHGAVAMAANEGIQFVREGSHSHTPRSIPMVLTHRKL